VTRLSSWTGNATLKWTAIFVALIVGMAAVLEFEIRSAGVQASGEPAIEAPGGHKLLMVIIDSLAPQDARRMKSFQQLTREGWSASIEPCLERMTKMCIEEAVSGRTSFSLFGFLRNLGPVSGGVGPNLLNDARAAGRRVAMLSRGDLSLLDSDADTHVIYKEWRANRELTKVIELTKENDVVVYHYAWHDLASHRFHMGSAAYNRSVKRADRSMQRLIDELPEDVDLMILGDHGHTSDGRHLQGLDTPTMLVVRSDRVVPVTVNARTHITVARYLAGLVTGLHSPDSAWPAEWFGWAPPEVAAGLPPPTMDGDEDKGVGRAWSVLLPLAVLLLFLGRVGGAWPAAIATGIGVTMGMAWEPFMDIVHYAHGIPRVFAISYWIPLSAGVIGFLIFRRLRPMWIAVVGAVGITTLLLYPLVYHYGVFRNAKWFMPALTVAPAIVWALRRRAILALPVGVFGYTIWPELTWIKVTNLEVREYRAFEWMKDAPMENLAIVGALALLCHLGLERGRWFARLGWAVVAAVGVLIPCPNGVRMVIFAAILVLPLAPAHLRARGLGLATMWSLPMLFTAPRQAGILAAVLGSWAVFLAVRGAMDREAPGRLWAWTAGLGLAMSAHVALGWTFGLNVSGIDFGFTLEFLPGDLHERLWWLIGIATTLKLMLPILLMTGLAHVTFGSEGRGLIDACGLWTMLRAAVVIVAAIAWMFAPDSSAGGTMLASVLQDGFYWSLIGLVAAVSWWALDRTPGHGSFVAKDEVKG
jgi:hypothetical protein